MLKFSFSAIHCGRPFVNSRTTYIEESNEAFLFGDSIEYKCLPGFQLFTSSSVVTCTESGSWYPAPPTCLGKNATKL